GRFVEVGRLRKERAADVARGAGYAGRAGAADRERHGGEGEQLHTCHVLNGVIHDRDSTPAASERMRLVEIRELASPPGGAVRGPGRFTGARACPKDPHSEPFNRK